MNSFGTAFRISILGESHGDCVGVLIDGCPAGLPIDERMFVRDLERRKGGRTGTTERREQDVPQLRTGLFEGRTTGAPILILFENGDRRSEDYESTRYIPRPGHADLTAFQKYGGFNDHRGGGTFSGRLTAGLVVAGVLAKQLLAPTTISAELKEAGGSKDIDRAVQEALTSGDSIGGLVECRVKGLPVGLGEPFFDSLESLISHMVFSIPAIKGIEFGAGLAAASMTGSKCNDEILEPTGKTATNNAGGINGGISNGNDLLFRVAVRPTPSIGLRQRSVDLRTGSRVDLSIQGRHDTCIALRMPVIVEAAVATVLVDLMIRGQNMGRVFP